MSDAAIKPIHSAAAEKTPLSTFARLRAFLRDARTELKTNGLKGLFHRYGWKLFAFVFTYYLIRDVTLYILIPWWVARRLVAS